MRIAIVEDHLMTRDFVRKLCRHEPDLDVVGEAGTGSEAVDVIVRTAPDIVVLDLELPEFDGFEVLAQIREFGIKSRILVLSAYRSRYLDFRLEQAGIHGFVDKCGQTADSLREAFAAFRINCTYFATSLLDIRNSRHRDPRSFHKLLTNQQISVLGMMAHLFTDSAIAERLEIVECTVQTHRASIMRKLDLHSRTELMSYAKANGFMSGTPPPRVGLRLKSRL